MGYPLLEIHHQPIYQNAVAIRRYCAAQGVSVCAVIKGFHAHPSIVRTQVAAGFSMLGSASLPHLAAVKAEGYAVETLALRIPMLSELPELVRVADISLNSEWVTLQALDREAARQEKVHHVILMRDLGDLREGVFDSAAFRALAEKVENTMPHLHLRGIGVNLTCYGSVIPTRENLSALVADARAIEERIGRRLEIVSGGSTSSLPLLQRGELPEGINHLRVGEGLIVPCDLLDYWQCRIPGLSNHTLILKGEVVEAARKPTMPVGEKGRDALGNVKQYRDLGWRKRVLLAMGVFDFGDCDKLIPCDPSIQILGASSDHLILDVENCSCDYQVGDVLAFEMHYKAMLFATANPLVDKRDMD